MKKVDVAIIGGGPAGLSSAIYTSRAKLSTLVFAGSPPGGQLVLTTEVENFPGFKSILGPELVSRIRQQAEALGAEILDVNIEKVDFSRRPFKLFWQNNSLQAEVVVIATGAKARWLGLPSEQRLIGRGVSACATCDGFFFKDKVVAVVGGGDTAMEEALTLTRFARKVYIIHRRDSFRATKIMQERVFKNPKIEIIWNAQVKEVLGKEKVEGVRLEVRNSKSETKNLSLDGLFIAIGHRPDTEIFKDQIELDEKGYVITTARIIEEFAKFKIKNEKLKIPMQNVKLEEYINKFNLDYRSMTSKEGIFAAGDCVDFVYRQAITAAASGAIAGMEIEKWLEEIKN